MREKVELPNEKERAAMMVLKDVAITVRNVMMRERFDNQEVLHKEARITILLEV